MPFKKLSYLYRALLDIAEKELNEIENDNINKLEEYATIKERLMKEITETQGEIGEVQNVPVIAMETLINRLNSVNDSNKEAIEKKKEEIENEFIELQTRKTALNAYQKYNYMVQP